jgi:hypothetical protein
VTVLHTQSKNFWFFWTHPVCWVSHANPYNSRGIMVMIGIIHHVSFPGYVFAQHAIVVVVVLLVSPCPRVLLLFFWQFLTGSLSLPNCQLRKRWTLPVSMLLALGWRRRCCTRTKQGGKGAEGKGRRVGWGKTEKKETKKDRQTMKRRDEKTGRNGRLVSARKRRSR